jgi:hypothetical protein
MRKTTSKISLASIISVLVIILSASFFATSGFASKPVQTIQMSQYTGYQVVGPYKTLRVKGSWIVPTANCTETPNSISNVSVIIDGIDNEGDGMEVGTFQNCVSGIAYYGAFVNIYPTTNTTSGILDEILNITVNPGDIISAQGTWRPIINNGSCLCWHTNFVDETTGGNYVNTNAVSPSGFTAKIDSGAFMLSSDGGNLTSLSPIYTGFRYTGVHKSDVSGAWTAKTTFGKEAKKKGFTLVSREMAGTTLSSLSSDGSSFEIS